MEIRQLATFLKLSELASFSKTAVELNYTQSAVTAQIRTLEDELGVRLFDRVGKTVALTTAGKKLVRYASIILTEARQAEEDLGQGKAVEQTLHIGTIESLCSSKLPAVIQMFYTEYPHINLKITTDSPSTIIDMLNHNQADIVYLLDTPVYDVNWVKVLEETENIVFVSRADSPLAGRKKIPLSELLTYPLLLTEKADNYRRCLDQNLAQRGLEARPFLELGNTDVIIKMVEAGLGLSFLPECAVSDKVRSGELAILDVADCALSLSRQVMYHKNKWLTEGMQAFISCARLGIL